MRISNCRMCSLCNSREHIRFPFGKRPANVMIIMSKESSDDYEKINENGFIDILKEKLDSDYYVTPVIKCVSKEKLKKEHVLACRKILKKEIRIVKPYLIILIGKLAAMVIFGSKYKNIWQNILFNKGKNKIFVCEGFDGNRDKLNKNLKVLTKYITDYYK